MNLVSRPPGRGTCPSENTWESCVRSCKSSPIVLSRTRHCRCAPHQTRRLGAAAFWRGHACIIQYTRSPCIKLHVMCAIRHSPHAQSSPFCVLPCSTCCLKNSGHLGQRSIETGIGWPLGPLAAMRSAHISNERRRRCPTKRHITTGRRCVPKSSRAEKKKILENHMHPPTWRPRPVRPRNNLPTGAGAGCAPQGSGTFLGPGAETVWGGGSAGGERRQKGGVAGLALVSCGPKSPLD